MKAQIVPVVLLVLVAARLVTVGLRRRRRAALAAAPTAPSAGRRAGRPRGTRLLVSAGERLGDVGMIAAREIAERVRGRIFQVGTLLLVLTAAAGILIPHFARSTSAPTRQTVGILGALPAGLEQVIERAGTADGDSVHFVTEHSLSATRAALRSGRLTFAIVNGGSSNPQVLLAKPASASSSPADPALVQGVAQEIGVAAAYRAAGLSATQAQVLAHAKPATVTSLEPGGKSASRTAAVVGLVLLFVMLSQYCTWVLIGVMQEKSSRVVEVLLAAVRPIQLLGGKVLGIGLVALVQAALVVGVALGLAAAVGSDVLQGAAPLALLAELFWLILGYAFYCWVYAAAGSTAERQDQVQTIAVPLTIPVLVGYVLSITALSTGTASLFFKVLAYVPLTAPFAMSSLVALGEATWWEFLLSAAIAVLATAGTAFLAARIYRRAVLRTGGRVRLREVLGHASRAG